MSSSSAEAGTTTARLVTAATPAEIARDVRDQLSGAGWTCSPVTALGPGAAFDTRIHGRSLVITFAPQTPSVVVVMVGHTIGPTGRLLRMSDEAERSHVAVAVDHALAARSDVRDVAWFTDAAWELERQAE